MIAFFWLLLWLASGRSTSSEDTGAPSPPGGSATGLEDDDAEDVVGAGAADEDGAIDLKGVETVHDIFGVRIGAGLLRSPVGSSGPNRSGPFSPFFSMPAVMSMMTRGLTVGTLGV